MKTKRWLCTVLAALTIAVWSIFPAPAQAGTVLRVGMTAGDIPTTAGQPNQGFEGYRFVGYNLYNALVEWDLSRADRPTRIIPALAKSWSVDPKDKTKWTFKLRKDVKFHDGSKFTADAVIWNYEKILNKNSPQYAPRQSAQVKNRIPAVKSLRKIDDFTVEITTKTPNSQLLYQVVYVLHSSPVQFKKMGGNWAKFAKNPSGTGPYKLLKLVPRRRAELVKNVNYWDKKRIPKHDKLILFPMPEATTRTAAILAGQVDFIESPAPDAIPRLKKAGMQIVTNVYPHVWPWTLSYLKGSPWLDKRVRMAANLAVDRKGMLELLGGAAAPAFGQLPRGHKWFGNPKFDATYNPKKAIALLKEAGYGPNNPVKAKVTISTGGSGQMQPLPMNEFIQANFKKVGIDIEFQVVEWTAMRTIARAGAHSPKSKNSTAINNSYNVLDPFNAFGRFFHSSMIPPVGRNWSNYRSKWVDEMLDKVTKEFDEKKQDAIVAKVHEKLVDDAVWVWIVHDVNPRALAPHVKGFVQAQNWFQDLTPIRIEK